MAHSVWVTVRVWGVAVLASSTLIRLRCGASGSLATSSSRARQLVAVEAGRLEALGSLGATPR